MCEPAKHLLLFLDRLCVPWPFCATTPRVERERWNFQDVLQMLAKVQGLLLITHKFDKT